MKERPILFSAPMVCAILEGRKTQTRRVVKCDGIDLAGPCGNRLTGDTFLSGRDWAGNHALLRCPYGKPGDRLWVRETWRIDGLSTKCALEIGRRHTDGLSFRADMYGDRSCDDCPWIPSIHMPRWASRITLEITTIRVERLQDISAEDCIAEGISTQLREHDATCDLQSKYKALWQSIYGPGSWDANPWVWVLEFKRVEGER